MKKKFSEEYLISMVVNLQWPCQSRKKFLQLQEFDWKGVIIHLRICGMEWNSNGVMDGMEWNKHGMMDGME